MGRGPVWTGAENFAPLGFDPRTVQPVASPVPTMLPGPQLGLMNVILLHSDHRYVSATHVTIFRVVGTNKNANIITRWFKYDRDFLHLFTHKSVPVIFEPPCIMCRNNSKRT